ncbi:SsgA family sporulation/cell division regulator [Nocardioides aurantiacus]|uniref:SsgA family sporulation/cell division regulator n=1 Tax=Nocardioides aurantiacus TaxID=86796 RepID=UPI00403F918B
MHHIAPLSALLYGALGVTSLRAAMSARPRPHRQRTGTDDVVVSSVEMAVLDPTGALRVVEADLLFDPADPFAVTARFRSGPERVSWTFCRDLLSQGLYEPVGDGDVRVWPCLSSSGRAVVLVELGPPGEDVTLQADSRAVAEFVAKAQAVEPCEDEVVLVDLDVELARILTA